MKAGVSACSGCSFLHSISLLAAILFLCATSMAQQAAPAPASMSASQPLITQAIDESQLTVLKGNTHPLARPQYDLGAAPATLPLERMLLVLKRSPQQETTLRQLLDNQQDKHSANYHHWLTPEDFGKQFGPTDADIQTITGWLQSHGFQVGTTKGRTALEFSGSASQVQEAFHTTIHKYIVNGEQHWANSSDPSIPTALTPAVAGVFTLHNFLKKPFYKLAKERFDATWQVGKQPEFTASNGLHALAPADYAVIYNINPVYNGAPTATPPVPAINGNGVTIGVVGRSDIDLSDDINQFRQVFGISGPTPQVIVNGPDPGDVPGDDLEATLDVSWSGAIAPGAQVDFVNSAVTNTTDGVVLSEIYIIENNLSNIMTYSFGACEVAEASAFVGEEALAEQAAAQGITFMASTGDAGAEGCDDPNSETVATGPISVNLPAATTFTTAVGGTMFNETAGGGTAATYWSTTNNTSNQSSALGYIPEDVWNESCITSCQFGDSANISAGGGGASADFSKPSWQAPPLTPNDGQRDVPDVALSAAAGNDPYLLCFQSSCLPDSQGQISFFAVGGTSASTPSFAGIMALVDQMMSNGPEGAEGARQGLANYALYPLAAAQQAAKTGCNASLTPALAATSGCVFNDVTVGNNAVPGEANYGTSTALYQAGAGYDQASGLGSMNVANLVKQWAAGTFTPTTTTLSLTPPSGATLLTISHGSAVSVQIGVTASSGTPAGDVSLIASEAPNGSTGASGVEQYTLTSGSVSSTTTQLPGGTYTVTAHYAGVSTPTFFAPSDSTPPTSVTVLPEGSKITLCQLTVNNNVLGSLPNGSSLPFGSFVFVRADVAGNSGQGAPTGNVTFGDSFGSLPGSLPGFSPVANPVALVADSNNCASNGTSINESNTNIGDGVINFDAGNHSISASYAGDNSFNKSSSAAPVTFTITPGFTGVSGLGNVTISAPGGSGTTTIGIIASSNFTTAVSFTCTGLPSEATCSSSSATGQGPNTVVTTTITVNTTAPTITMLQPIHRTYYFAMIFGGGLPLAGILLIASPRRRRAGIVVGLMMLSFLVMLPACGGGSNNGGGGGQKQQNPGTPAGTSTLTVTATAGSLSQTEGTFTLTIQ